MMTAILSVICLLLSTTVVPAYAQTTVSGGFLAPIPQSLKAQLAFPEIEAKAWLLFDHDTGWILGAENPQLEIEPASLTKIMTGLVVVNEIQQERVGLTDQVIVSENAWRMGGSRMFIEADHQVSVEDLLKGLIIQSGNDAAVALAEHVAGSEAAFAQIMNATAEAIGMEGTQFKNASGWPEDGHVTTVYDLALLSHAVVSQEGNFYELHAVREFEYAGIKQDNRNPLLDRVDGVDGIKTGHTQAAGYCLIGSAKRDNRRLTAVVVGSDSERSRARAVTSLLEYGFKRYENYVLSPEKKIYDMMLYGGSAKTVPLSVSSHTEFPVGIEQASSLTLSPDVPDDTFAPVLQGDVFGAVNVDVGGEAVFSLPLTAMEDVGKGGIGRRMMDWVRYLLR